MAIGWLTALKIVPWSDVIEAAPAVVGSARKFFSRTREAGLAAGAASPGADAPVQMPPLQQLQARVDQLGASASRLGEQQQASAALIQSLAEQNAQLVQAVDRLRQRVALLFGALGVLGLAGAVAIAAVWR